ncbi:hypothetical protein B0H13DRAFT_2369075 [Mycena leptocephala]|nr:hypothetical protein B0H13DRAFT_2369075 [Mycena leptocephala]
MRSVLSAVYFCITLASAVLTNQPVAVTQQSLSAETCGDPSHAVLFYQTYNSGTVNYYYTAVAATAASVPSGTGPYAFQGAAGFVFVTQEGSTIPFYRLHKTVLNGTVPVRDINFFTTNTTERDIALQQQGFELTPGDPLTYIYPTEICGAVPFYRVFNPGAQANFYTTSESERIDFIANNGYKDLGIAGYIYPLVATQCT